MSIDGLFFLSVDAENLYDLSRLDDQLVLGIKGTLSVVELGTLKLRLQHGREAKASRGELGRCLAPGYVFDATGHIVKDPNLRVQEAIDLVSGRVTAGGFDGEDVSGAVTMRIDGDVTTGILGADAAWERWLAGVAVSVSSAEGTFGQSGGLDDGNRGTVESSLTSVQPYARLEMNERLSAWGLLGFGSGDMTITEAANGPRVETVTRTDIGMRLGALGARGALLEADENGGIDLALEADAFLVQMDWEKVSSEKDTQADASRLRMVLEGSRAFALGEGSTLTPGLELGLRHDGGDAETGTGVEVGGRIAYADAGSGLSYRGERAHARCARSVGLRGVGGERVRAPGPRRLGTGPLVQLRAGVGHAVERRGASVVGARRGGARVRRGVRGGAASGSAARLRIRGVRRTRPGDPLCGSRARGDRRPDVARGRALVARAGPRDEPRRHAARAGERPGERRCPRARGAVPADPALVGDAGSVRGWRLLRRHPEDAAERERRADRDATPGTPQALSAEAGAERTAQPRAGLPRRFSGGRDDHGGSSRRQTVLGGRVPRTTALRAETTRRRAALAWRTVPDRSDKY